MALRPRPLGVQSRSSKDCLVTKFYCLSTILIYGSIGPIQSAQYVSSAEYTMVVKEKRLLQHYLYNAVS